MERLLADAKSQHDDFRKASGTLGRAADAVVAAAEHTRDIERVRRAVLDAAEQAKALHLDDQRVRMWRLARDLLRRARSDTDGDLQHARWELHDALCAGGRFREAITVFEEWREASRKVPAAGAGELKKQRGHVEALRWGEGHAAQLARVRDYWMRTRDWRLLALAEPPGDKREGFWTAARREFTKGGRALLALKDGFGHPFVTDRLWDYGWMSFDVSVYRLGAEVWRALYETLKRSRENHDGYLQSCRHNFHTMLSNSGQPERALEVFEEWFAVFSVREVENLSGMQDARRHRATLMESAGRIRDSIPVRVGYLQVALANPRLMEGKESEVDAVRWALAGTHEKLLHYESATPIRRSILADRAKRLGRDHLDTLHARVALAWNLDKRGIYGEALKLLESAHDAYVEVHQLHDSNRILQRARRLLSEVRFACGDAKGALRLREKWFKVFAADTD
ncbi:MAG: hypothetical protein KDC87_03070, partial [Planctomycetes bacterium]|nr:hypothetical protein [Planctomycetota bacterium]